MDMSLNRKEKILLIESITTFSQHFFSVFKKRVFQKISCKSNLEIQVELEHLKELAILQTK